MPVTRHRLWQLVADAALVVAAFYLAWILRFDELEVRRPFHHFLGWDVIVLVVVVKLAVFAIFGFYHRWWRYVSTRDMWGAARGVVAASVVAYLFLYFFPPATGLRVPRTIPILDTLLLLAFVATSRMLARTVFERPGAASLVARGKEVLVVGAGDAGQLVLRELLKTRTTTPIGLVDDDPRKRNMRLHGVRVLGTTDDLRSILRDQRPDEVLIAIPSAPGSVRQKVVDVARAEGVPVKTLPALHELISGDHDLTAQIRPVQVEDVLGREQVEVDLGAVAGYLRGKTVLVTGAGGSIGAELCRQIARVSPQRIVLVDQAEIALFEIERELVDERGFTAALPALADVKHRERMRSIFEKYRPQVVFHAAAYKHVALTESNPIESFRNNVQATKVLADIAIEFGTERFVLVSTDKAVNPRNVMGQSKALCEWIVEAYGHRADVRTRFVAVRFGNVLGSSGSVIPIFRRQLERGGPLTVTHPEMTRFFMTIPEAVSLVIQAGAIGGRGEIYVLDMGEPVKILDVARTMIRLAGQEGRVDVQFVGAKPGEKLHEELWSADETTGPTQHPKILVVTRPPVEAAWLDDELAELERLADEEDTLGLVSRLSGTARAARRAAAAFPAEAGLSPSEAT